MARKKSVRKTADKFKQEADAIAGFLDSARKSMTDQHLSRAYEYSILRLYREFELMMLDAVVGCINNDTGTISSRTGVTFPKHLTDEVCEYLIIGDGYFDFKGRNGLIKKLKDYVPAGHYLVKATKKAKYKETLEQLSSLRNLAAHNSKIAKARAKEAIGQKRMPEAGAWLKKKCRLENLVSRLKELADEINADAPY